MHIDSETPRGSSVESWARGRLENPQLGDPIRGALAGLVQVLEEERLAAHRHFLTVVVRTQAKRWEQLQDVLLCLAAQTDNDFEVLLMVHNVESQHLSRVQELVASYPASFASRVSVREVTGGGRTRPLAAAIDHASGAYLAFFDDDDLIMANWVEAFRNGANEAPGQLIRANVAVQLNRIEEWGDGSEGQRTIGLATAEYARTFNFAYNIERNHTPFMGFAFPVSFFSFWGESFDEELPVCEDWDVALRAALLLGVYSSEQLTAIYRQWEGAQTSYTAHDQDEWERSENRVRQKVNQSPFLAPRGGAADVLAMAADFRENETLLLQRQEKILASTSWRLLRPVRGAVRVVRRLARRNA